MPGVPDYCSLVSYVDDSKLHLSFLVKDIDGAARQITEDLRKVGAWCCQNSLLINPDKTKLLLISTRQMLQNTPTDLDLHVALIYWGKSCVRLFQRGTLGCIWTLH